MKEEKNEIEIDKEFEGRLWNLDEDEKENLKQSIIKEGCREPLILWNNILIDGHNRYSICKAFDVPYRTIIKHFNSRKEVLKWIDNNQLSRRNLLDWQRDILLGRLSKINKQDKGGDMKAKSQNVTSQKNLADDLGVSKMTLNRNEKFVDAYENIEKNIGKEDTNKIISIITKQDAINIAKETPEKQKEYIYKIINKEVKNLKEAKKVVEISNRREEVKDIIIDNSFELDKLYLGDAIDILKSIPDNIVDCIMIDPPWGVEYQDSRESFNPKYNDSKDYSLTILDEVCKELKRISKSDVHLYCVFGMENYIEFYNILSKYFSIEKIPLIWKKNNHTLRDFNKGYAYQYEPIFFGTDRTRLLNNKISRNILEFDIPTNKKHKAQKPIDLLEYLICNSTVEGEVVIDAFMGSGSSCVAAKKNNRRYIGIEIEEDSYNIAKEYIKNN